MEVNAQLLKEHRTSRAFTQQHLADACDVSLRTIQRVERYGVASNETLMSLSAVFEVEINTLLAIETDDDKIDIAASQQPFDMKAILIAMLFGSLIGALTTYFFVN